MDVGRKDLGRLAPGEGSLGLRRGGVEHRDRAEGREAGRKQRLTRWAHDLELPQEPGKAERACYSANILSRIVRPLTNRHSAGRSWANIVQRQRRREARQAARSRSSGR